MNLWKTLNIENQDVTDANNSTERPMYYVTDEDLQRNK